MVVVRRRCRHPMGGGCGQGGGGVGQVGHHSGKGGQGQDIVDHLSPLRPRNPVGGAEEVQVLVESHVVVYPEGEKKRKRGGGA